MRFLADMHVQEIVTVRRELAELEREHTRSKTQYVDATWDSVDSAADISPIVCLFPAFFALSGRPSIHKDTKKRSRT